MLQLLKDSWGRVQDQLRRKVGDAAYDAWVGGLRPLALERGILYLEARTRMVAERVQRLFGPLLSEVLSEDIGTHVTVEVLPAPEVLSPERLEVGPSAPVVDDSNRTAFLVLKSLLEGRPPPSNLYFFHGPAGVGKTFLLRWWQELCPRRPMVFDVPELTRVFQAVVHEKRLPELRAELAQDRALVIDEVHRIARKRRLQETLLAVLKDRQPLSAPVLLASRWHPRDIRDLDEGLMSWFLSGFVARVDLPGPVGRLRYLRALDGAGSRNGRREVIETLAHEFRGGFPDLRRAWLAHRGRRPFGDPGHLQLIDPRSLFERLCDRVCERLQVEAKTLQGPSQIRRVSLARKILAYLCVQEGLSRAEVGRFMNNRSRAAISYLTRSLEASMASSAEVRAKVEELL